MKKVLLSLFLLLFLFGNPQHSLANKFDSPPKKIIIPSVGVDLPVFTARVAFNTWEVRTDGASYGQHTSLPGNKGNVVIFSHALPHLFGNLVDTKKGDFIHIFTDNDWFVYRVTETVVVDPKRIDIIFSQHNSELTLYTCIGADFTKRFVVKSELIGDASNLTAN